MYFWVKPLSLFCVSILLLSVAISRASGQVYLYNTIVQCKPTDVFDVEHLKCRPCDTTAGLKPAEDRLTCLCDPNNATTIADYDNLSRLPVCDVSTNSSVASVATARLCDHKWLNRTASSSATVQHVQLLSLMPRTQNNNCTCPPKTHHLTRHHGQPVCIPLPLINDFLAYNSFALTGRSAAAAVFGDLAPLTFFCRTMRETRACNHLANLCVLHRYRPQPRYSPCSLFQSPGGHRPQLLTALKKTPANDGAVDDDDDDDEDSFRMKRSIRYPRLFAAVPGKDTVDLLATKLDHAYGLTGDQRYVQLIQHRYDLTGNLRAMQQLNIGSVNPCAATMCADDQQHIHFGRNVVANCRVNIVQLMEHFGLGDGSGEFVELFLNYTEGKIDVMRTIPVLVRDEVAFADNVNDDRDKWHLVNRFVTVDTFTDPDPKYTATGTSFSNADSLQQFKSLRYVNSIELQIRLEADHEARPNRIFAPLLVIDYATLNTSALRTTDARAYVDFSFAVTFRQPSTHVKQVLDICLYAFSAVVALHTLLQTYRYKTRQQRQFCDVDIFGRCLCFLVGNVAAALFWAVLTTASWCVWTVYYADAQTIRLLVPIGAADQRLMGVLLYVAVPLKGALVAQQLWRLCQVDVFFVDWERPRSYDSHHHIRSAGHHSAMDTPSVSSVGLQHSGGGGGGPNYDAGVSAWRTYFVANEWLRLGTQRKFSMLVHAVLVGGALLMMDHRIVAAELATGDPIVVLASTAAAYIVAYGVQRVLGRWLIGQRVAGWTPAPRRFVDVCSVANVSVFVLQLDTFGYYVHGRSPHGFADTDQTAMLMQLRREQEHSVGHRGLLLTSEQQTYAFRVSANLRLLHDRLMAPLRSVILTASDEPAGSKFFAANMEKTASAYFAINRFLSAFIDHGLKDLDYTIRDKTLVQRILSVEQLDDCSETCGVFYSDSGQSFDNVLLYGNELELFQLELMIFALVVCLFGSGFLALFVAASVHMLIRVNVARLMKRNLCRKTLIDPRFLL